MAVTRTPRKQKAWATHRTLDVGDTPALNQREVLFDLLALYKTDVGVSRTQGVTVMRIVGSLNLGNDTDNTTAGVPWVCFWGIAWVPEIISAAAVGSGQIPDPAESGERDTTWIQRGAIWGTPTNSLRVLYANGTTNGGQHQSFVNLDIRQQRTQPTTSSTLVLITSTFGQAGISPMLWHDLAIMMALP